MDRKTFLKILCLLFFVCIYCANQKPVYAASEASGSVFSEEINFNENTEEILDSIEDEEINELLEEIFEENVDFKTMVKQILSGEMKFDLNTLGELCSKVFLSEIQENKKSLISVFILCVMAALFSNFTKVLEAGNVADIGYYILYLLLIAILLRSFSVTFQIASDVLMQMTKFMKVLLPAFFVTIVAAKGAQTALIFYEFILTVIYIVEVIIQKIVLPICNVYLIINLINQISKEDLFSKMAELLHQIVLWILKWMFAVVIGINIVHSIITPAVDEFKNSVLNKTVMGIPGIGNTLGSMSDILLGSGVLIKNGVGTVILILLVVITITPLVKLFVCMLMYKVTAALIQPVGNKRMIKCVDTASEATALLIKCVVTTMSLFFLAMAIITVAAG